ncbi:MAG: ABC transporter ATP-binding protein, partial [Phycisphaerae bacterium]
DARTIEEPRGAIRFEHVHLRYGDSARQALTDICMNIAPGTKLCLMGHSGAGKTSIANLMLRLYDPTAGRILLDDVPLTQLKRACLRKLVAYVPQEPIIFNGTLADNIAYGAEKVDHEQIVAAARAAEIHEFIESLPDKYRTVVGERGLTLSGGQKQRISLARALLHQPRVLVLDDCTSALDAHTEARIQRTLRFALADRTALIITHRVSLSAKADWIVVLDHGRIVEQGTHDDLLALQGHYWHLVCDQLTEQDRLRHRRRAAETA